MAFRDNQDRDKVLTATDIVEVIGEHVALKPKGREFVGLCPFHDDKKPSMAVVPAKQIFKCFPCGAGGSVFDFVMRYHKMTFPEALRYLADRAGIQLTPWKPQGGSRPGEDEKPQGPSLRERLSEANRQTLGFFEAMLRHEQHGAEARDYLHRRGVADEMIERFQLGVAPDRWDGLATMVGHKGWDVGAFVKAGLIKPRKIERRETPVETAANDDDLNPQDSPVNPSNCFDLLRHRLVFPICDQLGRPVAFGGRRLNEEDEPKYLNSPESAVFHKSATLYGLHLAKKAVIDSKTAVMVEGYTDVIACHQHGATNVVAALGTALTFDHAKVLKRFAEKIVLVMDGDAAGQRAADRAIEIFLTADLDVFLATIPSGADPDELLREHGLDGWNEVVASAQDALAWQFDQLAASLEASDTVTGRQRLIEAFARRVVDAGLAKASTVRRPFIVQRLADLVKLPLPDVERLLDSYLPRTRNTASRAAASPTPPGSATSPGYPDAGSADSDRPPIEADIAAAEAYAAAFPDGAPGDVLNPGNPPDSAVASAFSGGRLGEGSRKRMRGLERAERRVIAALITDNTLFDEALPDGRSVDEAIAPAEFVTPRHRAAYQFLFDALCDGQPVTLAGLMTTLTAEFGRPELGDVLAAADAELTAWLGDEPTRDQLMGVLAESAAALTEHDRERRFQRAKQQVKQQATQAGTTPIPEPDSQEDAASPQREDEESDGPRAYDPGSSEAPVTDSPPPADGDTPAPPAASDRLAQLQALLEDRKAHPSPKRIARVPNDRA